MKKRGLWRLWDSAQRRTERQAQAIKDPRSGAIFVKAATYFAAFDLSPIVV